MDIGEIMTPKIQEYIKVYKDLFKIKDANDTDLMDSIFNRLNQIKLSKAEQDFIEDNLFDLSQLEFEDEDEDEL